MISQDKKFMRQVAWECYKLQQRDDRRAAASRQRETTPKGRGKGKGRGKSGGSTSGGKYQSQSWKYDVEPKRHHPPRSPSWNYRAGSSRYNDRDSVTLRPSPTIKHATRQRATKDVIKSRLKRRDNSYPKGHRNDRKR